MASRMRPPGAAIRGLRAAAVVARLALCAPFVAIFVAPAFGADELGLDGPGVAPLAAPVFTARDLRADDPPLFVVLPAATETATFLPADLAPADFAPASPVAREQREARARRGAPTPPAFLAAPRFSGPVSDPLIVAALSPHGAPPPFALPAAPAQPLAAPANAPQADAVAEPSVVVAATPADLRAALDARSADPALRGRAGAARRKAREEVAQAYAARGDAPAWIDARGWTDAARGAFERLRRAHEDGLDLGPAALAALGDPALESEIALSEAVVAYARQASGGRVEPWRISSMITAKPPQVAASAALARVSGASSSGEAGQALRDFNPPHPGYVALRDKLAEMRREKPRETADPIPAGPTLKIGMRDARVPLIRSRLGLGPDETAPADAAPVYDIRVASAVREFQRGAGLPASGQLTPRTVTALSGGEPQRLEHEILANMERWRWLPRALGQTHIAVNIPEYALALVEDGRTTLASRVVVGKPESPTPVFSDAMRYLVVNPSWTMPPSILEKEALPNLAADPDYYTRRGYEVTWRDGKVSVRQPPGERNALGHVKFMFPNDHAVYLHDTPQRGLFSRDRRAYSHGCVRVDQPFRLAEQALAGRYTESALRKMVGGKERTIPLDEPIPIHLTYFTAKVDQNGRLTLAEDIYGHSRRLRAAMGLDGPAAMDAVAAAPAPRAASAAPRKPRPAPRAPRVVEPREEAPQETAMRSGASVWSRLFGGGAAPGRDPALAR